MTTVTDELSEQGSSTVNASGEATVTLGPRRQSERWEPSMAAVGSSLGLSDPSEARLWLGTPGAGHLIGGTATGGQDSTDLSLTLRAGQTLTAVWTGGTPGTAVTLSLTGKRHVTGRRAVRRPDALH